ncbi:8-amino-7-oxononanoate synthase [Edaphovirga cremea]|uniref:8-amino-7-oxononanoate synthase n=1 Tax=Edaphovirga cremea TaxID=2267246 RepID=UPI003988ABA6
MSWAQRIEQALDERLLASAYRQRQANQGGSTRWLMVDGRRYLNFSSNDYLGLSQHTAVIQGWQDGAKRHGVGSGGSGHVTGYTEAHAAFEQRLAQWQGYDRALLFISGFGANQALLAALMQKGDRLLADRLSHASLLEAAMHAPSRLRRFQHNQPESLAGLLQPVVAGETLVVTEGVFSMDGDEAPLAALAALTHSANGWLLVDDAHGVGVIGEGGRGSCWKQEVCPDLLVITFGKAFGVSGAAVLCDEPVAEYLLQFARHLIYSTSMPAAQVVALDAALDCIQKGDELRQRLNDNIHYFREGASRLPLLMTESSTAIQPLIVGENHRALELAGSLREEGLWVTAIRPPTVPEGSARLRITLTAVHQRDDIDRLLEVLHDHC